MRQQVTLVQPLVTIFVPDAKQARGPTQVKLGKFLRSQLLSCGQGRAICPHMSVGYNPPFRDGCHASREAFRSGQLDWARHVLVRADKPIVFTGLLDFPTQNRGSKGQRFRLRLILEGCKF